MGSDDGKKKKIAIVAVSSLVLVVVGVAVTASVVKGKSADNNADGSSSSAPAVSSTTKAVQAICQPTEYKEACVDSLKDANSTDPKELVKTGFQVIMKHINEAAQKSTTLKELAKDPRTSEALRSCKEMMEYSIDQLQVSFEKVVGDFDISKLDDVVLDLKTWLSGALTFQDTCLDNFQNTTGEAGEKMKEALDTSMKLTANAITMVSEFSTVLSNLNIPLLDSGSNANTAPKNRRLLQSGVTILGHGEFPDWLDSNRRRLLTLPAPALKPDLVVAQDGSGKYNTINAALNDIPRKVNKTFVLHIKEGVYKEKVIVDKQIRNLVIVGDGPTKTKITWADNFADGKQTSQTATLTLLGWHYIVRDIGVENSAGPEKHQAVAIRSQSDQSVYYNCRFDGYQDTVYAHANKQFYRDCTISGSIDFVFGAAPAVYQNCIFLVRRPMPNQQCIVTADGRPSKASPAGTILQNCTITGDETYLPVKTQFKAFLGRPWKQYSRTVIMQSFIDDIIIPEGWMPWAGTAGLNTLWYGEFGNRGPGSNIDKRVAWKGYRKVTPEMAAKFTAATFIHGNQWIPQTGVPYSAGMMNV